MNTTHISVFGNEFSMKGPHSLVTCIEVTARIEITFDLKFVDTHQHSIELEDFNSLLSKSTFNKFEGFNKPDLDYVEAMSSEVNTSGHLHNICAPFR